jgi:hypothetical protein
VRQAVTDASGHFETTIRPTSSALYAAWSGRAATSTRPRLNTLSTRARAAVVVRAPKPVIRKRHARRLRGGRVRAVIVVRNPIAGLETLQCRLYVWNRQVAARRFPRSRKALVFQVVAPRNAKVRAVIGRWEGRPIAARSSRIVRLWPRSARDRGSAPSRRR